MEQAGWPMDRVLAALHEARSEDATFGSSSILGSMCTAPHDAASAAYQLFLETNLGDPAHFPGAARLEGELLADLAQLTGGPSPSAARFLTGGTEANLLACFIAREQTGGRRILAPATAHFSFEKAARLLQMDLVRIPTVNHRADPRATDEAIDDGDVALIVGIAGTTELGLVDPIPALAALAERADLPMHVDAAFGGYVLPFLDDGPAFDLSVPGATSIGLDPHKMGMAAIPAGALVLSDPSQWDTIAVETGYVSTDTQSTLMGTRPGAAAAAAWATHRAMGLDGYKQTVARCMALSRRLAEGIRAAGGELVVDPELNVVTFRADDAHGLAKDLASAGYRLNVVPRLDALRVVVNPHVTSAAIEGLLEAYEGLKATQS